LCEKMSFHDPMLNERADKPVAFRKFLRSIVSFLMNSENNKRIIV